MIMNTKPTGSPASRGHNPIKAMPMVTTSVTLSPPAKPPTAAPSQETIAKKAYEVWQSLGRVIGRDEENWLEAERQLRQV
jgi:hypothetical protein